MDKIDKKEFLTILKQTLIGEVPNQEVESNLQYYHDYISSGGGDNKSEQDILQALGDPRLIARTIIDTYQVSNGTMQKEYEQSDSEFFYGEENEFNQQKEFTWDAGYFSTAPKWYHKFIVIGIVILFFIAAIAIGGIILNLFFTIGIPLLLIWFVYRFIVRLFRK